MRLSKQQIEIELESAMEIADFAGEYRGAAFAAVFSRNLDWAEEETIEEAADAIMEEDE